MTTSLFIIMNDVIPVAVCIAQAERMVFYAKVSSFIGEWWCL